MILQFLHLAKSSSRKELSRSQLEQGQSMIAVPVPIANYELLSLIPLSLWAYSLGRLAIHQPPHSP